MLKNVEKRKRRGEKVGEATIDDPQSLISIFISQRVNSSMVKMFLKQTVAVREHTDHSLQ